MKLWRWVGVLAGVLIGAACEGRCASDDNAGGGRPTFAAAVHVQVQAPATLLGDTAAADLARLLEVDPHVVAQTDLERPLGVLVGTGKADVEAHVTFAAAPNAQDELSKRFELEPLMFRQIRIKPSGRPVQCILTPDHIACAAGAVRAGSGTFVAERLARRRDAGATAPPALSIRVVGGEVFEERVLPAVRSHLERGLAQAKAAPPVRTLLDAYWDDVAKALHSANITGAVHEQNITLKVTLPLALPATWLPGAARISPKPGWMAISWRTSPPSDSDDAAMSGLVVSAMRARDGQQVHGAPQALEFVTSTSGVNEQTVAWVAIDLAALGGEGMVIAGLHPGSVRTQSVLTLEASRSAFLALLRLVGSPL